MAPATIHLEADAGLRVKFEQSHLRQVLYNLVDNALRYATGRPNSVGIQIERGLNRIAHNFGCSMMERVFRPTLARRCSNHFLRHVPRGRGFGLYLEREFCVTNRAVLSYSSRREVDGHRVTDSCSIWRGRTRG